MSLHVLDLLGRGRAAGPAVSPLDAVMGEDWGLVDLDRARTPRPVPLARLGLSAAHRRNMARPLGAGGGAPGARPQAMVKMIRKGGASDLRGLRAQMAYLAREGGVTLQRAEAFMGIEIDAEQRAAIEAAWRMPPEGSGRADRTAHFLASFPEGTPHGAAERAGRAWAEEMFGSGRFGGDSYDYYTAFHTDRAYPHMHVVVYRRGLEHGAWMKVSQRSDMNYDAMRAVLVEVAGREGIALEATPRLARGVHDRAVPDAEYRRAEAGRRAAVAPAHTAETAVLAAAAMIHYARRYAADAALIEGAAPSQAAQLRAAAEAVAHGRALAPESYQAMEKDPRMTTAEIEERRQEVRANFETMEKGVERMEDGAARMRLLRRIDGLKARAVPLMAEPGGLVASTIQAEAGRYQGLEPSVERHAELKAETDGRVRAVAETYGVHGEATVERHAGGVPSKALANAFERAEARERERSRAASGESAEERETALAAMRREIGAIYGEARARAEGREGRGLANAPPDAERDQAKDRPPERGVDAARRARTADAGRGTEKAATRHAPDRQTDARDRRERDDGLDL